jgi:thioredoxin-dependent peroxiredoxin
MKKPAPDATLTDQQGQAVTLSSLWVQAPLLLVFYPKDNSRVCTTQLCDYRDNYAAFRSAGIHIVGVNSEPAKKHADFSAAKQFPFPLLSDVTGKCCAAYGATAWWGTRRLLVLINTRGEEVWRELLNPFTYRDTQAILKQLPPLK